MFYYLRKDNLEQVRAEISEFKGRKYISIRVWYKENEMAEWKPGKNGINIPVDEEQDFLKLVVKLFDRQKLTAILNELEAA